MQRGFMDPNAALLVPTAWEIVAPIKRTIDFCGAAGIPVIFTEYVYAPAVPCLRGDPFGPEHLPATTGEPTGWGYPSANCLEGTTGPNAPNTVDELKPIPGELVVRGHTYDKFYGTRLDLALRARDIRFLMMAGILTDICVNCTLLSASTREYRVTALTDCMTTIWPDVQEAVFGIWGRKFARLMTADVACRELTAAR
jgi:nicotinamidase-related amidase